MRCKRIGHGSMRYYKRACGGGVRMSFPIARVVLLLALLLLFHGVVCVVRPFVLTCRAAVVGRWKRSRSRSRAHDMVIMMKMLSFGEESFRHGKPLHGEMIRL